jgi:hypothetical protein
LRSARFADKNAARLCCVRLSKAYTFKRRVDLNDPENVRLCRRIFLFLSMQITLLKERMMNTSDIQECTEKELELVGGGALFDLKIADIASLTLFNSAAVSVNVLDIIHLDVPYGS